MPLQTSDAVVSEMAMLAHAGIASGQLAAAGAALASVNDLIASGTNTFNLAARIAQEGEANLTIPFIAGKVASLLDLLKTLEKTVNDTITKAGNIDGVDDEIRMLFNELVLPLPTPCSRNRLHTCAFRIADVAD